MPPTTERRSLLMRVLRASPGPVFLLLFAGGGLMLVGTYGPPVAVRESHVWTAGAALLALGGCLFATVLWGGVYLNVVEASRGMPGLRPVAEPTMSSESAAKFEALKQALTGLGFRPDGWFSLDDFDETHISAWKHGERPAVAFIMYFPVAGSFRLRFVRKFWNGDILVTSTRLTDLAYAPPQGLYLQARNKVSVEALWAWHLEGESLFPIDPPTENADQSESRELYTEISARWAGHRRRDRTWLLAVEPVEECWRIFWLCGLPLRQQFERGWTTPFWQ